MLGLDRVRLGLGARITVRLGLGLCVGDMVRVRRESYG